MSDVWAPGARYSGTIALPPEPRDPYRGRYIEWAIMPDGRLSVRCVNSYIFPDFMREKGASSTTPDRGDGDTQFPVVSASGNQDRVISKAADAFKPPRK
jgi:hypothetical protein